MTGAISSANCEATPGEICQFFRVTLAASSAGLDEANVQPRRCLLLLRCFLAPLTCAQRGFTVACP